MNKEIIKERHVIRLAELVQEFADAVFLLERALGENSIHKKHAEVKQKRKYRKRKKKELK